MSKREVHGVHIPPTWILDMVTLGGNTVVCKRKPKLQHLLMCHVTAQGMELRMQEHFHQTGLKHNGSTKLVEIYKLR
jgi:hypothetical protein